MTNFYLSDEYFLPTKIFADEIFYRRIFYQLGIGKIIKVARIAVFLYNDMNEKKYSDFLIPLNLRDLWVQATT